MAATPCAPEGDMLRLERRHRARARLTRRIGLLAAVAALAALAACSRHQTPSSEPGSPTPAGQGGAASQSLDAKELKAERSMSVEELIQGRFAGVQVTRTPGGGFALRIRGAGSLTRGGEPLYVVDGVALPAAPGGALLGVDPRDIEQIEVLKDAAATSPYGVRGANGVILIRTKRGRRPAGP